MNIKIGLFKLMLALGILVGTSTLALAAPGSLTVNTVDSQGNPVIVRGSLVTGFICTPWEVCTPVSKIMNGSSMVLLRGNVTGGLSIIEAAVRPGSHGGFAREFRHVRPGANEAINVVVTGGNRPGKIKAGQVGVGP